VDSILASRPVTPGSILGNAKTINILNVAEIYRQRPLLSQWTVPRL